MEYGKMVKTDKLLKNNSALAAQLFTSFTLCIFFFFYVKTESVENGKC